MTEKEKTDELLDLIDALCDVNFSKSQAVVDAWVSRLNKVYSNEYRHTYSTIFFKIQQIMSDTMSDSSKTDKEILEILGENLNVLGNRIDELQPRIVTMPIIRIQSLVIRSFQTILDSK